MSATQAWSLCQPSKRLRRELADAKLDVEILRKATAYFAKVSR